MISNYMMFQEGRVLGTIGAGIAGTIGGPLGAGVGLYHRLKGKEAKSKKERYKHSTATDVAYTMAGTIPVIGAVTNVIAANDRYKLEKAKPVKAE